MGHRSPQQQQTCRHLIELLCEQGPGGISFDTLTNLLTLDISLSVPNAALLLNGNTYINIHTAANPGGEIRGQLVAVPEPTSLSLLGIAVGGCLVYRRRRNT